MIELQGGWLDGYQVDSTPQTNALHMCVRDDKGRMWICEYHRSAEGWVFAENRMLIYKD